MYTLQFSTDKTCKGYFLSFVSFAEIQTNSTSRKRGSQVKPEQKNRCNLCTKSYANSGSTAVRLQQCKIASLARIASDLTLSSSITSAEWFTEAGR